MAEPWRLERVTVAGSDPERPLLLNDVSLAFEPGTITLLIGRNGAGKSTLLETMAGLRPLNEGAVKLGNEPLWTSRGRRRRPNRNVTLKLGLAMQHSESQWFAPAVRDELLYSLRPYSLDVPAAERRMSAALGKMGLPVSLADRDPWTLSGGQQRKLAIACLLACEPDWLLLDEPAAGLDGDGVARLRDVLAEHKAGGGGAVVATHDLEALLPLADRVILVDGGQTSALSPVEAVMRLSAAAPQAMLAEELLRRAWGLPQEPAGHGHHEQLWAEPGALADWIALRLQEAAAAEGQSGWGATASEIGAADSSGGMREPDAPVPSSASPSKPPASTAKPKLLPDHFDPRFLILSYLLLSGGILMASTVQQTVWAAVVAAAAAVPFRSAIRPWLPVLRGFAAVAVLLAVFGGLSFGPLSFQWDKAETVVVKMGTLMLVMTLGFPLLSMTTPLRLQRSLQQTFGWTARLKVPIQSFALFITLMFRFIPLLQSEWARFAKLAHARGKAASAPESMPVGLLRSMLLPYLRAILRLAESMADALEAKGFGMHDGKPIYGFRLQPQAGDWRLTAAAATGFAALLAGYTAL